MSNSKKILKNMTNRKYAENVASRKKIDQFMKGQMELEKKKQETIRMEAHVTAKAIVDEAMPNLRRLAREEVLRFYMTIVAFSLHEGFGFGKKRLHDFTDMFCRLEYILKDNMYSTECPFRLEEMYETLKEETGFDMFKGIEELSKKYKMDDKNGTWKSYDLPDKKMAG